MEKGKYNIGLAVADLMDTYSRRLAEGAMKAAERLDANLVIFPGKYVGKDIYSQNTDSKYEYQHNALFAYASAAKFDYLIVAVGTIAHVLNNEQRQKMLEYFGNTPVLSLSSMVAGYDCLLYDNRSGVMQAVDNLAKKQGRKHIGMMVGDLENFECAERYKAYREALQNNGLEFKESYCVSCDLSDNVTTEAEQLIILNPELDAIVCANDIIATSVYEVLRRHNKHIGTDMSVVGFDDLPFAEKLEPPLASVRADAFKLGEAAMERAVGFLNGEASGAHLLPTEFIPRQSCFGQSETEKDNADVFSEDEDEFAEKFSLFFGHGNREDVDEDRIKKAYELINGIRERFVNKKTDENDFRTAINNADIFFNQTAGIVDNITNVQSVIDSGYRYFMKIAPKENTEYLQRLYNYFYKRFSLDIAAEYHNLERRHAEKVHNDNLFIRDTLMITDNLQDSYARMLRRLALIGASTSFTYILSEPVRYSFKEIFPSDCQWLFMGYAYGEDTYAVPKDEQKVSAEDVFKNEYILSNRRHTLVAVDLFSASFQYGMILCEPDSSDFFDEIELISYQLSSVVKVLYYRGKQEKTFIELHNKNLALKDISCYDELTELYNPRGFYNEAGKLVTAPENQGIKYIVCYADMNDLKMVNERYGHEEGDFSLKSLGECLKKIFGERSVVGRMNGDEFAAIAPMDDTGSISEIQKKKKDIIQSLNFDSGKPYLITMSIGLAECTCADSYDLKDAVDRAYGLLKEAKSNQKRGRKF